MQLYTIALHGGGALLDNIHDLGVEWVAKRYVGDKAILKEGKRADTFGAVNDLVRYYKVHRLDLLLQRTDGAEGDDAAHTDVAQSSDVRPRRYLVRRKLVVSTVTSEEGDRNTAVLKDHDRGRRLAPWCLGVQLCNRRVAIDLVKTSTANDGDVDRACTECIVRN